MGCGTIFSQVSSERCTLFNRPTNFKDCSAAPLRSFLQPLFLLCSFVAVLNGCVCVCARVCVRARVCVCACVRTCTSVACDLYLLRSCLCPELPVVRPLLVTCSSRRNSGRPVSRRGVLPPRTPPPLEGVVPGPAPGWEPLKGVVAVEGGLCVWAEGWGVPLQGSTYYLLGLRVCVSAPGEPPPPLCSHHSDMQHREIPMCHPVNCS